ncbi:GNAT family N-acetyltransferase [Chitinophaga nivalis]|uniref:GNAT family N-acetyltransferase n=1 Tax=Chitinophaga nivalis TaxID=2991709 RepID=A0ABT3IU57_9BACT|nr:GNAT family N-acetyltransferase [Chitinophaga nivalis]MCW3462812.1 GNAT family N-acetyltransferase [Chitinophaga nivalis]MCW3487498.1 GNAT family N-acetyltransferase [Chitinophaga nivalis]
MLDFRIIEYGSCDYHTMLELRNEVLRKPLGLTFSEAYLQQEMNDVFIGGFLAVTDQPPVLAGCCILTPVDENTVQLRQMAVSPLLQGKGAGREIIAFAEQYAIRNGFNILTMHARNEAIGFYQKLGYETFGEAFTEVGILHMEMKKQLL